MREEKIPINEKNAAGEQEENRERKIEKKSKAHGQFLQQIIFSVSKNFSNSIVNNLIAEIRICTILPTNIWEYDREKNVYYVALFLLFLRVWLCTICDVHHKEAHDLLFQQGADAIFRIKNKKKGVHMTTRVIITICFLVPVIITSL